MASSYLADSEILTMEEKEFLKNLPEQKELEFFGIKILLVHGSPRRNNENIYPNMQIQEVEDMIKSTKADVIFCGHTHIPCGYQTNTNQTVVNVGSVGRPFSEQPKACYAIMEINEKNSTFVIKHNFVKYNVEKSAQKIIERGFEGAPKLAKMLLKATSRYPE
jgi:predicted phosphodiesterase